MRRTSSTRNNASFPQLFVYTLTVGLLRNLEGAVVTIVVHIGHRAHRHKLSVLRPSSSFLPVPTDGESVLSILIMQSAEGKNITWDVLYTAEYIAQNRHINLDNKTFSQIKFQTIQFPKLYTYFKRSVCANKKYPNVKT